MTFTNEIRKGAKEAKVKAIISLLKNKELVDTCLQNMGFTPQKVGTYHLTKTLKTNDELIKYLNKKDIDNLTEFHDILTKNCSTCTEVSCPHRVTYEGCFQDKYRKLTINKDGIPILEEVEDEEGTFGFGEPGEEEEEEETYGFTGVNINLSSGREKGKSDVAQVKETLIQEIIEILKKTQNAKHAWAQSLIEICKKSIESTHPGTRIEFGETPLGDEEIKSNLNDLIIDDLTSLKNFLERGCNPSPGNAKPSKKNVDLLGKLFQRRPEYHSSGKDQWNPSGGARKRSQKRNRNHKRSTLKRSTLKRSRNQKRSTLKRSTRKRSTLKRSTPKRNRNQSRKANRSRK
jgi:hypothetical protein